MKLIKMFGWLVFLFLQFKGRSKAKMGDGNKNGMQCKIACLQNFKTFSH